jgi:hypothetical protein
MFMTRRFAFGAIAASLPGIATLAPNFAALMAPSKR